MVTVATEDAAGDVQVNAFSKMYFNSIFVCCAFKSCDENSTYLF